MTYFDIQKDFSQIVANKLNEHCVLFAEHMANSQGEIAKIDYVDLTARLFHPNHMYRVLMEDHYLVKAGIETIVISIRYYDEVRSYNTVWNNEGRVVFEKTYYKIGKDYYSCNKQEAENAIKLRLSRSKWRRDYNSNIVEPADEVKFTNMVSKYVKRRVYRFAKDVAVTKCEHGTYLISYTKKNGDKTHIFRYLKR